MITKLIGIAGYSRVGKDTYCQKLLAEFKGNPSYVAKRYAFADMLKTEVKAVFERQLKGISPFTEDRDEKEMIRPLLIGYAREKRKQNPYYWIELLSKQIYAEMPDVAVISDVRFENEAEWIKKNDGKVIVLRRPGISWHNEEERDEMKKILDRELFFSIHDIRNKNYQVEGIV